MTADHTRDDSGPRGDVPADAAFALLENAGASAFELWERRWDTTNRRVEMLNFTAEDVTLRETTYEFVCQPEETRIVAERRIRILGLIEKKTLPLSSLVDETGARLHALPTSQNGDVAVALLMHLAHRGGFAEDEASAKVAITEVVFNTDNSEIPTLLARAIARVSSPSDDFRRLLADLSISYLLCVELPNREDGQRGVVSFSYAASLHRPKPASTGGRRVRQWCLARIAGLVRVSTSRFEVGVAGLDEAKSAHVQLRVPPGLRAARLTPQATTRAIDIPHDGARGELRRDAERVEADDRWEETSGLATGGVGFWQRPTVKPGEDRRVQATQGRLIVDLALESRGTFTAIMGTSLVLTAAIALLLWFYPSMYGDKEAQDVLVTGILIAPALVTSFVVANREPGVVSRVAQKPRLILFVNLILLLSCAIRTIAHRGAAPDIWDLGTLAASVALTLWLLVTWTLARRSEDAQARFADDKLKPVPVAGAPAVSVVPTRHGPRHHVQRPESSADGPESTMG